MKDNEIAMVLIILAVATHYIDYFLKINSSNSISVGLLTAGITLLNSQKS